MSSGGNNPSSLQAMKLILTSILYLLVVVLVPVVLPVMFFCWFIFTNLGQMQLKNARRVEGVCNWFTYLDSNCQTCISVNMLCSGEPDVPRIKRAFLEKYALKHPLLRQYIRPKLGYAFWMKEENFDIDDHVLWCPELRVSSDEEHRKVVRKLHQMPFGPRKSPWRYVIFPHGPNFKEDANGKPTYTIQFVFNHALGDGHSMTQALYDAIADEKVILPEPKRTPVPFWYEAADYVRCLPYFPLIAIKLLTNEWNMFRDRDMTEEKLLSMSPNFPVETVKRIKDATKVSFVNVTESCIVGAVKKYIQRHPEMPMPPYVHIGKAHVLRNSNAEQPGLENNYFLYPVELPVSAKGSAKERLLAIGKNSGSVYNLAMMKLTALFFTDVIPLVPRFLGRYLADNLSTTVYLGTAGAFTGDTPVFGNGNKLHEFSIHISLNKKQGIALVGYTQGSKVQITLNISPSLVSGQQEADIFLKDMEDELKELQKSIQ